MFIRTVRLVVLAVAQHQYRAPPMLRESPQGALLYFLSLQKRRNEARGAGVEAGRSTLPCRPIEGLGKGEEPETSRLPASAGSVLKLDDLVEPRSPAFYRKP